MLLCHFNLRFVLHSGFVRHFIFNVNITWQQRHNQRQPQDDQNLVVVRNNKNAQERWLFLMHDPNSRPKTNANEAA